MSDRDSDAGQSRWSSARDRKARELARAEEREALRQQRLERKDQPQGESDRGSPRRLTGEERQTVREYRFPTVADFGTSSPPAPEDNLAAGVSEESVSPRRSRIGTSRRWREGLEAASAPPDDGQNLPPLPGDSSESPGRGRDGRNGGRVIIFGAILFLVMAIVAFLPFGPLRNNDEPDPTATSAATIPSLLDDTPEAGATTELSTSVAPTDEQQVVCIDPGHGGWDPGWERPSTGDEAYNVPEVNEAELNLGMGLMLRDMLEEDGITVVMTRETGGAVNAFDEDVNKDGQTRRNVDDPERAEQAGDRDELQARINICNDAGADLLISVHLNGFTDRSVRGYETLYTAEREFGAQNEELATLVYRQLDSAMRGSDYGEGLGRRWKPDNEVDAQTHDFGSEQHYIMTGPAINNPDYTIIPSAMPGVIVEGVFLSNDQDAQFIIQLDNQQIVCQAYAAGILDYFERYPG